MIWWKWAKTTTALRICLWLGLMVYPFCNASESCMCLCIVPSLILCHVYATVATHVVLSGHEMDNPQSYKIKLQNLQYSNVWLHLIKKYPPCLSAIDIHIQWLFLTVNFSMCMLQPTKKKTSITTLTAMTPFLKLSGVPWRRGKKVSEIHSDFWGHNKTAVQKWYPLDLSYLP